MQLGALAQQAAQLAKTEAQSAARTAINKAILIGCGVIFLVIALAMSAVGVFELLKPEFGSVLAAFMISGGSLLIAGAFLYASSRTTRKKRMNQPMAEAQRVASIAEAEVRNASPYIVAGAFLLGIVKGMK